MIDATYLDGVIINPLGAIGRGGLAGRKKEHESN
jgi:hypothetical protein